MGMTIDEAIKYYLNKNIVLTEEEALANTIALNTMRKYQKIKEQVDTAIDKENFAISGARLIQIREIINGNDD